MQDAEINSLFCEWATWVRSKRLYSPNPNTRSAIGNLLTPAGTEPGWSAELSADMARLHLSIVSAGPRGALIVAHYLERPYSKRKVGDDTKGRPIMRRVLVKQMAAAAGMRPESWNRAVRRAARQIFEQSRNNQNITGYELARTDG